VLPSSAVTIYCTGDEKSCEVLLAGEILFPLKVMVGFRVVKAVPLGKRTRIVSVVTTPSIIAVKPVLSVVAKLKAVILFSLDNVGGLGGGGVGIGSVVF
jgi:hypothetical protein